VRRLIFVLLCLAGLGFVAVLILWSNRRRTAAARAGVEGRSNGNGAGVAPQGGEAEQFFGDVGVAQEMARIRADSFERASHSLLFSMAQDRGIARGRSRSTRTELLDAILTAEGVNADQPTSVFALQRLRALAEEVGRQESDAIAAIVLRARRSSGRRTGS
jgi:hypothetical protein